MSRINLNFDWRYTSDFKKEYLSSDYNDDKFERVNIPHCNKLLEYNNFDEGEYQFVSCYRKEVYIPEDYNEKSLLLNFEGVASHAEVYINGRFSGEHFGGYTPFEIDISDKVDFGRNNLLAVCCDSTERTDIPPFGNVIDYLTYGGIYREVWLEVKDKRHIRDIFIKTFNVLQASKDMEIDVELSCALPGRDVLFQITDTQGSVISQFSYHLGSNANFNIRGRISNVSPWDMDNPVLYTLRVQLKDGTGILDEQIRRFGFREISFCPDGFFLNGQKHKLIGLNRHQSYPYVGYAMPESAQKKDADILKYELGINIVRTSHYPQSRHFLDRCDEIGLLVFEEIPGWQHIGEGKWIEVACANVREMILRDRNHPSIILWGVRINESPDCSALYSETNRIAHQLDNTRPTGGVRNFAGSNLLEDVYTYNDFIHMGSNPALKSPDKVIKGNVPYLVTEHNGHMYPTKRFDNEDRRIEHALRHLRVIDRMMGEPRISGCIGWCAFDYNTHRDFGSGDRICYHGVGDMFRIPKPAWYVYASQQDRIPVMEIPSSMDIGEHPAGDLGTIYAFTNCDFIKMYKNDTLIHTFYPDRKQFPHITHPPIRIDDLIGDQLQRNEGISEKDAKKFKRILKDTSRYGLNLPIASKLMMGRLMLKYKLSMEDGIKIFGRYISNWGGQRVSFKFEGYKDGQLVKTLIKAPAVASRLEITPDSVNLAEKDTYDVTRIVVRAVDGYGNLLVYSNDAFVINLNGPIELIGPRCVSLIGGARAFWVKSAGKSGIGVVTIHSEKFGNEKIEIQVEKIRPNT